MKQFFLKSVAISLLFAAVITMNAQSLEMQVPILYYNTGLNRGSLEHHRLTFSKTNSNKPLRIFIADDTPSGSGAEIRNSVWLAATTAALQRKVPLSGAKIEIEFSNMVDGPSAGAVLCLAIMSALDGKEFPADFAMTGTIMPDGTVGVVGGIAEKVTAASKAGKKRFCIPAFQRYELQENGDVVDLFQLGDKLKVEICPVENINDAYCYMHKMKRPATPMLNERKVCTLSRETEQILLGQAVELDNATEKIFKKSKSGKEFVDNTFNPEKIEAQLLQGLLLPMYQHIKNRYMCAEVYLSYSAFITENYKKFPLLLKKNLELNELPKYRDQLVAFKKSAAAYLEAKANHDGKGKVGAYPDNKDETEISAQLEPIFGLFDLFALTNSTIEWSERNDLESLSASKLVKAHDEQLESLIVMFFLNSITDKSLVQKKSKLALTMPQLKENGSADKVESLLYTASLATKNAFTAVAKDNEDDFLKNDKKIMAYLYSYKFSMESHDEQKQSNLTAPAYNAVASIMLQIDCFTRGHALLIKYGPDLNYTRAEDGSYVYKNTAFLSYLLRTARNNALQSIAECRSQNIPCLIAILQFQQADLLRDDPNSDKLHDVLESYWRANLIAKALQMSFQK